MATPNQTSFSCANQSDEFQRVDVTKATTTPRFIDEFRPNEAGMNR